MSIIEKLLLSRIAVSAKYFLNLCDFNELSAIQKIKLIQIGVQYIIPRLKYSEDFMIDESNKTSVNFRELFNFEKNKLPN